MKLELSDFPPELIDQVADQVAARLHAQAAGDGYLRGADAIADHLGCPRSRVYDLSHRQETSGFPVHRDGAKLTARKSELDAWVKRTT